MGSLLAPAAGGESLEIPPLRFKFGAFLGPSLYPNEPMNGRVLAAGGDFLKIRLLRINFGALFLIGRIQNEVFSQIFQRAPQKIC